MEKQKNDYEFIKEMCSLDQNFNMDLFSNTFFEDAFKSYCENENERDNLLNAIRLLIQILKYDDLDVVKEIWIRFEPKLFGDGVILRVKKIKPDLAIDFKIKISNILKTAKEILDKKSERELNRSLANQNKLKEKLDREKIINDLLLKNKSQNSTVSIPRLQTRLTTDQRGQLFGLLVKDKFIPETTNANCFNWAFDTTDEIPMNQPELWQSIKWNKSVQKLRVLIGNCIGHIGNPEERKIEKLFLNQNDNPLKMYNPSPDQRKAKHLDIIKIIKSLNFEKIPPSSNPA
jgi:hypothetical protein